MQETTFVYRSTENVCFEMRYSLGFATLSVRNVCRAGARISNILRRPDDPHRNFSDFQLFFNHLTINQYSEHFI